MNRQQRRDAGAILRHTPMVQHRERQDPAAAARSAMEAVVREATDPIRRQLEGLPTADRVTELITEQMAQQDQKFRDYTDEQMAGLRNDLPAVLAQVLRTGPPEGHPARYRTWRDVDGSQRENHRTYLVENLGNVQLRHREMREGMITRVDAGITEEQNIPGAAVASTRPWYERVAGDPFAAFAQQLPATAGTVKDVKLDQVEFTAENALPDRGARDAKGGSTGVDHVLKNAVLEVAVSHSAEEDISGTIAMYQNIYRLAWNRYRGKETAAVCKAAVKAGTGLDVATGVANKLPTAANVVGVLAKMPALLGDHLMDPMDSVAWVVHPELYALMISANSSGFAFDQRMGLETFQGYPIVMSTHLDDGLTDGEVSGYIAWWEGAVIQAQRGDLMIEQYRATRPGATTLFAQSRFLPYVVNPKAIVGLQTGA